MLFFKSKKLEPPKLEKPDKHLAFVLLEQPVMPSEEDFMAAFKKYARPGEVLKSIDDEPEDDELETADQNEDEKVLMMEVTGVGRFFLALMPSPVPDQEAENCYPYSISSFSEEALKPHHAHLLVMWLGLEEDVAVMDSLMAFTSVLAAAADASGSVGVYWGNAGATHRSDFFLGLAEEKEIAPRTMLWNGFSRGMEKNGRISVLSKGMHQLGLPNLYLIAPEQMGGGLIEYMFNLLSYLAERGEAIPAGDTVGPSEQERHAVKYCRSPADRKEIVWSVQL